MSINDALTITFLGIGVVFGGLLLTNLLIVSFSFFPRMAEKLKRKTPQPVPIQETATEKIDIPPDILAVIATVLEVERRLQNSLFESRFTFK